jgi:hypothetical protein
VRFQEEAAFFFGRIDMLSPFYRPPGKPRMHGILRDPKRDEEQDDQQETEEQNTEDGDDTEQADESSSE